ncbi:MAG: XdhC family protein [Candidatus Obscuribacterales bacterium]|nr:XdhC family protein [Candidatus Obscuribacterales bacterium]
MDELARLIDALSQQPEGADDKLFAIATVVNTKGSVYRRPGARMLIAESMKVSGAVSAGCLERDIIAQCETLVDAPRPLLLTYDGESADELIFGLRLGCDGIVQILVEPAAPIKPSLDRLQMAVPELFSRTRKVAAVTVFAVQPSIVSESRAFTADDLIGTALLVTDAEDLELQALAPMVKIALLKEARAALDCMQSQVVEVVVDGLTLRAFVEVSLPRHSLLVFGAGQDTVPLLNIAEVLGWQTTHLSNRNFVEAYEALNGQLFDSCVIMTHDYEADKLILESLFRQNVRHSLPGYIGIVGPKRRSQKLFAELALLGIALTDDQEARVFSPVGLDIGAERPEEIALSILAEMQAVRTEHFGGLLKDKQGPIHSTRVSLKVSDGNDNLMQFPEVSSINASCNILDV